MAPLLRLVTVGSVLLFACAPAVAQLPVAPEPHLALDELVKEYKRFQLALPPASAKLVRIKTSPNVGYQFGFRAPALKHDGAPWYLVGTDVAYSPAVVELIKPDRTAIEGIELRWTSDLLCLVAQCRIRGQNEFAELLYARIREETSCTQADVVKLWRRKIYEEWHPGIWSPHGDRKEVLRFLKEAVPEGNADIRDLELTLAPRKSKPGTTEFLIDDLTENWGRWKGFVRSPGVPVGEWERGEEPYLKVAELGLDAVPALIEHLGDRRFTRHSNAVRVGHVVGQLLDDLSGGVTQYWMDGEKIGGPKQAREWLIMARKVGEEKWLADRVLPGMQYVDKDKDPVEAGGTPNKAVARALGAKYPARLGEAYQTVLYKRQPVESEVLARAIVLSKLPREKKLSLLEEGAKHKEFAHRIAALDALADLDTPTFHKHLIATIKSHPEEDLAGLVRRTADPACWDALTTVTKRAPVQYRLTIIDRMRWATTPEQDKKTRRERLRFLVEFLADETAGDGWFDAVPGDPAALQVRDLAAVVLARELEFKVELDNTRGPFSRAFIRAAIAKAAAEELARLKK